MIREKRALRYVGKRLKHIYKWEKEIATIEWAEKNVFLNPDVSPIRGYINFKYSPHLREVLNDFDKQTVWKQIANWSTQCGKTLFLQIAMAKSLDTDPCRMQWAIPNSNRLGEYIEEKIEPFLRGVKSVKKKTEDYVQKEKLRDKKTLIRIAGGGVAFTGTSAGDKRARSVKYIFMDEVALFEPGSFVELEGRTKASEKFYRKVLGVSSKKKRGDEIDNATSSCETIKEWHTKCKECGHHWYAGSKDFKFMTEKQFRDKTGSEEINISDYKKEAMSDVYIECPNCSHHISSEEKDEMILAGEYFFHIVQGDEKGKTIAYKANALAMYLTTFETIAGIIIEAKYNGSLEALEQAYLDYFNEYYEEENENVGKNDILLLSNGLSSRIIPKDAYRIYMGIDTQKDHFWYVVEAVCYGNIRHTLMKGRAETTGDLEVIMGLSFPCEDGGTRGIDRVGIDRMGIKERTVEIDAWVEYLVVNQGLSDFIYLTMGISGDRSLRPYVEAKISDELSTGMKRSTPLKALKLNNTMLKNELHNAINRSVKKAKGEEEALGFTTRLFYINKDIVDEAESKDKSVSVDYERQMTSEEYIYPVNRKTGHVGKEKVWLKKSENIDNHFWDCHVICTALGIMDQVNSVTKPEKSNSIASILKDISD